MHDYLQEIDAEDVMTDPTRILNGDETGFALCPKSGKILAPKGWKNIYEVKKSGEKETLTVLMVFSANGAIILQWLFTRTYDHQKLLFRICQKNGF